jgi:hypothetical protein
MSDEQAAPACEEFETDLTELALGILTGRARTATLAHVESCPRCAEELEQLARAADAVVQVAPEVDPPMGFEVRLFNRMGVADVPARRARPPRWALAAAATVVALAIGLGIGLSTGSRPGNHPTVADRGPGGPLVSFAALRENGREVGKVYAYGGSTPWMYMTLSDSSAHGRVVCEVVTTSGVTRKVGAFSADEGYGAWGAPLPVAPQDVRTAEVVSASGGVIATATLT